MGLIPIYGHKGGPIELFATESEDDGSGDMSNLVLFTCVHMR